MRAALVVLAPTTTVAAVLLLRPPTGGTEGREWTIAVLADRLGGRGVPVTPASFGDAGWAKAVDRPAACFCGEASWPRVTVGRHADTVEARAAVDPCGPGWGRFSFHPGHNGGACQPGSGRHSGSRATSPGHPRRSKRR